jgi:hypothetical protein
MSPQPTGRVVLTSAGADLILTRTFRAAIEDVWKSITDPDCTARWFGRWEGDAAPGRDHLTFVQHLTDATSVGDIGPGWEYYLDMLIRLLSGAARILRGATFPEVTAVHERQSRPCERSASSLASSTRRMCSERRYSCGQGILTTEPYKPAPSAAREEMGPRVVAGRIKSRARCPSTRVTDHRADGHPGSSTTAVVRGWVSRS